MDRPGRSAGPFHVGGVDRSALKLRATDHGAQAMADQHQVNSIIATAICDCSKEYPEQTIDPEEAKQMAKCIIEALTDAGLEIRVQDNS